jgi:hypothetical protein
VFVLPGWSFHFRHLIGSLSDARWSRVGARPDRVGLPWWCRWGGPLVGQREWHRALQHLALVGRRGHSDACDHEALEHGSTHALPLSRALSFMGHSGTRRIARGFSRWCGTRTRPMTGSGGSGSGGLAFGTFPPGHVGDEGSSIPCALPRPMAVGSSGCGGRGAGGGGALPLRGAAGEGDPGAGARCAVLTVPGRRGREAVGPCLARRLVPRQYAAKYVSG